MNSGSFKAEDLESKGLAPPCPTCGAPFLVPLNARAPGWLCCPAPDCSYRLWLANYLPN